MDEPRANDLVTSKLRLVKPLGAGGMGSVWLADHLALHTQVVVKFIAEGLAKNKDVIARFEREAAAAAQVKSPHVVQILDHGVSDAGAPFIVMELLEGRDLGAHIQKYGRLGLDDVGEIVSQLCRALARAHERGIVHRDIKPQNIFLCDAGSGELFVKLLDFGIAKGASIEKLDESTKTGTVVGSPYYMSPEQLVGAKDIDFRTDLWSVGVVAFEAITGTHAFEGQTIGALAVRIHNDPLPNPSERCDAATPALDAWFHHACARVPANRFGSAKEMADALLVAITGDPSRKSMTVSGSAVGSVEAGLAKTMADVGGPASAASGARSGPDANALSYAGVERTTSARTKSRGALIAASAVVACVLAYGIVRAVRAGSEREVSVSPPASIVVPPSASIASAPLATSAAPVVAPSASETPKIVVVPALTAKTLPSAHASATVVTAPSASAAPVHSARPSNEDDIK